MTTSEEEAKQLDSVTDHVQEQELDASKAQQAMSVLAQNPNSKSNSDTEAAAAAGKITVSKEDVAVIISELEVSEEVAERALREVGEVENGKSALVEALRRLVVA
uniref:Nascent polypeptide-associated complex subunit alpha-like UBA domain-containing protein n=1 Tax=Proboscia inermis TaxID=420281 RepID=A0A7S0CJL6_9STRA|mmetsp:Transcript_35463/g.41072  ORF Transcript_35463/g.41072 Transcript_35463/m.41072 type:complete len:105 (-) Transcript_35463:419-733(-)|eukprot:CAMPEP_0171313328 /NCGR_PEP_ID=MMETSP0816-20121228/40880_1 /TAXON_ID=420281 /ORGANISM="Proboscia inermis, Strain CCAP1064/1" /LENGTH=104 /DNA_ID=CAMNT_0011800531 /DNA_START=149 /DNA_END=463 /DNA_ORIENTATION=+